MHATPSGPRCLIAVEFKEPMSALTGRVRQRNGRAFGQAARTRLRPRGGTGFPALAGTGLWRQGFRAWSQYTMYSLDTNHIKEELNCGLRRESYCNCHSRHQRVPLPEAPCSEPGCEEPGLDIGYGCIYHVFSVRIICKFLPSDL